MKLLILGGTKFLGPHIVDAAKRRGASVSIFHRGQTNPGSIEGVETLIGERDGGLDALRGRRWDAVIDTCGFVPRIVAQSTELLADAVDHYVFVSSISAYAGFEQPNQDETAPLAELADPASEDVTGDYGPLKAACERAIEAAMSGRVTCARAGLIVGPLDHTDRFTYWPWRLARGGRVVAPGVPSAPAQFIDARDLAQWLVHAAAQRVVGPFVVTGPRSPLPIGELLAACNRVAGAGADIVWVGASDLEALDVSAWSDMPVWVPPTGPHSCMMRMNLTRAVAAGLAFRPLETTIRDTLAWVRAQGRGNLAAGLSPEREADVLVAVDRGR